MFRKKIVEEENENYISQEREEKIREEGIKKESVFERYNPVRVFPNNLMAARFWFYVSVLLFFVAILEPIPYWVSINNREHVVIMDEAGGFFKVPTTSYQHAVKMHEHIAKQAAKALLNRNPNGFDEPKELAQLYLKNVYKKIIKQNKKIVYEFKEREIHQKCEILNVDLLKKSDGYVMARIKGQLIRGGVYESQSYTEGFKFILDIKMVRNPKLGENLRLPYAVSWYSIMTKRLKEIS